MKPTLMTGLAVVLAVGLLVGIFGLARMTHSDQAQVAHEAGKSTSKAMRLLNNYRANLFHINMIREELGRRLGQTESPLPIPPDSDEASSILQTVFEKEEVLAEFQAYSKQILKQAQRGMAGKLDQRMRELVPDASSVQPMPKLDWGQTPEQITRNIAKAIKQVERLSAENDKLLKEAMRAADEALRAQVGQADARDNTNALHVKAVVTHLQGEVLRSKALASRLEAQNLRLRAMSFIAQSSELQSEISALEARKPTQTLQALAKERTELTALQERAKKKLAAIDAEIAKRKAQIAEARKVAETAQKAMLGLEAKGYEPKDPADVKRYTQAYRELSQKANHAGLRAKALQTGTLEGVRLSETQGTDPLSAPLVPTEAGKEPVMIKGLETLEKERALAADRVANLEAMLKDNAERAAQAEKTAQEVQQGVAVMADRKQKSDSQAATLLTKASERAETASKTEDEALATLDKADKAYSRAARTARDRGDSDMKDPAMRNVSSDKETRPALTMAQADVQHAIALVHLQRARDLRQHGFALIAATKTKISGVDAGKADELIEKISKAQEAATEAVENSIELLGKARLQRNYEWIGQASLGAAHQLKATLTTGPVQADALADAVDAYQAALEGREGSKYLKPYVPVLKRVRELSAKNPSTRPKPEEAREGQDEEKGEATDADKAKTPGQGRTKAAPKAKAAARPARR